MLKLYIKKFVIILFLAVTCAVMLIVNVSVRAEKQLQAEHIVNQNYGQKWEGKFGSSGYIVLSGDPFAQEKAKKTVYSDMYSDIAEEAAIGGFSPIIKNSQVFYSDEDNGLNGNAPISSWGITAQNWLTSTDNKTLFVPGSSDNTNLRLENTKSNDRAVSLFFTLKDKSYVTVYVFSASKRVTGDIGVYLYNSKVLQNKEDNSETDYFYGGTPLAKTVITIKGKDLSDYKSGIFVTFKIEDAGDYQIVATRANPENEDYNENFRIITPGIGGVFFDDKNPMSAKPYFISGDCDTKGSWEGTYGKDGYMLFAYDLQTSERQAYTKNIYTDKQGNPYVGKVTFNELSTKTTVNNNVGNYEFAVEGEYSLSDAFISRIGAAFPVWDWRAWYNREESGFAGEKYIESCLNVPGNTGDYIRGRVGGPADSSKGSIAFTLTDKAFEKSEIIYITVYHNQIFDGKTDVGDVTFGSSIYKTYYADASGLPDDAVEERTIVRKNGNGGLYVTYALCESGDYSIIIDGDSDNGIRGTIQALFFDIPEKAEINYHLDGGLNNDKNPIEYYEWSPTKLYKPSKEGYVFVGWYSDENLTYMIEEIPARSVGQFDVYAKFEILTPHNITYVLNGGINSGDNKNVYYELIGVSEFLPATRENYNFCGWYSDPDFTERIISVSADCKEDIILYAKWSENENWNIVYHLNGGKNSADNPEKYYKGKGVEAFAPAVKKGYLFSGWYLNEDFSHYIGSISGDRTGDIDLYAKYTKKVVISHIEYKLYGAKNDMANPVSYKEGTTITLAAATKEGYTFEGWYTDEAFTNKVTGISAETTGDITLYAKFTKNVDGESGDSGNTGDSGSTSDSGSSSGSGSASEKKGCFGSIALGAPAIALAMVATAVAMKKKKED